jgi:hypothetical protein
LATRLDEFSKTDQATRDTRSNSGAYTVPNRPPAYQHLFDFIWWSQGMSNPDLLNATLPPELRPIRNEGVRRLHPEMMLRFELRTDAISLYLGIFNPTIPPRRSAQGGMLIQSK